MKTREDAARELAGVPEPTTPTVWWSVQVVAWTEEGCCASPPQFFPDESKARSVYAQECFKKGRRSIVLASRTKGASPVEVERHDQGAR